MTTGRRFYTRVAHFCAEYAEYNVALGLPPHGSPLRSLPY